ncbi:MAG: phosphoribosylanthranilate isomerase [Bacteroidales bacterium]|nr:phosphoribosylanthranilate isomerase [Bacteroidales bacterium]
MNREPLQIKVCGMRDPENLEQVCALEPEYVGFIFHRGSKRFVGTGPDPALFRIPGPGTRRVGVFINEKLGQVKKKIELYALDAVQLHGNEPAAYCRSLAADKVHVIKVLDPHEQDPGINEYKGVVDYFLFDSAGRGAGGTGKKFDWKVLEAVQVSAPYFLSGGIGPGDATAIRSIHLPEMTGVDVNSRFEVSPGIKDVEALRGFINHMRT